MNIEHFYNDLHVRTCDTLNQKATDKLCRHYSLMLEHKHAHQMLYFIDFATMTETANAIVRHQGLKNRVAQYKSNAELRSFSFGDRYLAKHINSR